MRERTKNFRKGMTDTEKLLWYHLRNRRLNGYKFVREYPIDCYIVDFVCRSKKLIIELDGGQHAQKIEYDEKRTKFLDKKVMKYYEFGITRYWKISREYWNVF